MGHETDYYEDEDAFAELSAEQERLDDTLIAELIEAGCSPQTVMWLLAAFSQHVGTGLEFEEIMAAERIRFSSPDREAAVRAAFERRYGH